ncbi:MAG: flagellar assembly peptidoglycan hydrolase FlgJ [Gammaproteobacteria bacterium]
MLNVQNADVYTDFSGLARLKNEARQESPEALKEVAKQFESLFLNMVLKSMREAKLADGLLDNDQSNFYRDMYDQQLAIHLSGDPGVGLADLIAKQLGRNDKSEEAEKMALEDYLNSPVRRIPSKPMQANAFSEPAVTDSIGFEPEVKNSETRPIQSARQFVKQLYDHAQKAASELGVEPKVILAQAALETGWGKSVIQNRDGSSSFNLFNIKAGSSWRGKQTHVTTLEFDQGVAHKQMAGFRAYESFQDSFDDYVRLIKNNPRYNQALKHAGDPERYMIELQKAGYATDPHYADKVMSIYHSEEVAGFEPLVSVAMK